MVLNGKNILVTGGTDEFGRELVLGLMESGACVAFSGDNEEAGRALAASSPEKLFYIPADISRPDEIAGVVQQAAAHFGMLHGCVNNALFYPRVSMLDTDEELYDKIMDGCAKSAFFTCGRMIDLFRAQKSGGSIVNIGSLAWEHGFRSNSACAAADGSVHCLTHHIARGYAAERIRCNYVTVTRQPEKVSKRSPEEFLKEYYPANSRFQTGYDAAACCAFLLSDAASQVTSCDINCTGGFGYTKFM